MHAATFSCPRTCPLAGDLWCRFRPLLDAVGPVRVDSHTVKVAVEYRDAAALEAAVVAMGGQWLGHGCHHLYQGDVGGLGFTLPGWRYPLVLAGSSLAYDDYGGRWGRVGDLSRLQSRYLVALAQQRASELGWLHEPLGDGLLIHHPSGGSLTVAADGTVDANGFHGVGCHDAIVNLDLGRWADAQAKPEYEHSPARVSERA